MPDDDHQIITDKLDDILKILNGNGKTGMCAKVNFLWGSFIFLIGTVGVQAVIFGRNPRKDRL